MRIDSFRCAIFGLTLLACGSLSAQTAVTEPHGAITRDDDPLAYPTPDAPLLSFVSPDASLVARPDESKPQPSASAAPAPMEITLETAPDATAPAETTFRTDTRNIVIRWRGENLPVGASVRIAWVADDVGGIVDPGFVIDQFPTEVETPKFGAHFTLSRPGDGWAAGKYRVELFVDGELKETLPVTISE